MSWQLHCQGPQGLKLHGVILVHYANGSHMVSCDGKLHSSVSVALPEGLDLGLGEC